MEPVLGRSFIKSRTSCSSFPSSSTGHFAKKAARTGKCSCKSMLRIIQKWIVQNVHLWMISKHAQNHPKVDYTKHPISDDLETRSLSSKSGLYKRSNFGRCVIIQKWIIQNLHLWMICKHAQNHPKVDCTKLPPLDDLQACSESSKSGLYKTSNFSDDLETRSLSSKIGSYKSSKFG